MLYFNGEIGWKFNIMLMNDCDYINIHILPHLAYIICKYFILIISCETTGSLQNKGLCGSMS
jgi:hypothetical protein